MGNFVRIDSWHTTHSIKALFAVALFRMNFRNTPGLTFHKILGTGKGETFTLNDADPRHWVLLTVWDSTNSSVIDQNRFVQFMNSLATHHRRLELLPLSTRGSWARKEPFSTQSPQRAESKIAVITRARIKIRWWRYFYSQVPPVIVDLHQAEGLLERFGIGEAPVGLQGTLSIWQNHEAIKKFAYQTASHQDAIAKTTSLNWYSEELFARFEILSDEQIA